MMYVQTDVHTDKNSKTISPSTCLRMLTREKNEQSTIGLSSSVETKQINMKSREHTIYYKRCPERRKHRQMILSQ